MSTSAKIDILSTAMLVAKASFLRLCDSFMVIIEHADRHSVSVREDAEKAYKIALNSAMDQAAKSGANSIYVASHSNVQTANSHLCTLRVEAYNYQ